MTYSENLAEPGEIEVLTFYAEIGGNLIGVAQAPDDNSLVSIVGRDRSGNFFNLLLNGKERDLLIDALIKLSDQMTSKIFIALLRDNGLPEPISEFRFDPARRWRFDYSWPDYKVALEVEGGIFIQGRHSRGTGMLKDMEKYNRATVLGWAVLRTTPKQLLSAQTINDVRDTMRAREAKKGT